MKINLRNPLFHLALAIITGFGLGLAYSWQISPVSYVDASPAILRSDFKDQYRILIAASYASTKDLSRARARLELLGNGDITGELSAQAQRMLSAGEPFDRIRSIAQLAADLGLGVVSVPHTSTAAPQGVDSTVEQTPFIEEPFPTIPVGQDEGTLIVQGTLLSPAVQGTPTPRPTSTSPPPPQTPFTLVGQDTVCDPAIQEGLLQFILMDARRRQVPGVQITITWPNGENRIYSGLKPELGNGYADFIMLAETIYSIRVVQGGSFVPNISAPTCTDPQGGAYLGGLLLTFQQP